MDERPFANRDAALLRIQGHLNDPVLSPAPVFLGREGIGKTVLLRQFEGLNQPSSVGVYTPFSNTMTWPDHLIETTEATMQALDIVPTRLEERPDEDDLWPWFVESYLPALLRVIRRQRRLLFLLDDLDHLLATNGHDALAQLDRLRGPRLGIAASLNVAYDNQLEAFAPLVHPKAVFRLTTLDADACAQIIAMTPGVSRLEDDAGRAAQRITGGEPAIVQRLRDHLMQTTPLPVAISARVLRETIPALYTDHQGHYRAIWESLTAEEKLVLIALSRLTYDDPLRAFTTGDLEGWLIQTDHPLDSIAINAVLRSLIYRELLHGSASAGVQISADPLQKWLLEHAENPNAAATTTPANRLAWIGVLMVIIVTISLIIMIVSSTEPDSTGGETPIPTADLSR